MAPFSVTDTFDLFNVTCKQRHRTAFIIFINGTQNGSLDSTCKGALKTVQINDVLCHININFRCDFIFCFTVQVVKNLVWLGKVLRHLPLEGIEIRTKYNKDGEIEQYEMDEKDHSAKSQTLSLLWLMKRLCREATFEMANHPRNTIKVG